MFIGVLTRYAIEALPRHYIVSYTAMHVLPRPIHINLLT